MAQERMMTVWEWVGLVLMTYGIILVGVGIYLLKNPYTRTVLHHLHPNLWWGVIMTAAGVALFLLPRRAASE